MPATLIQSVASRETGEAVKAIWDNNPSLQGTCGALLKGRQTATPPAPYGIIEVEPGPSENIYSIPTTSGTGYQDFQKVTITGRGTEDQMSALARAIVAQFWFLDTSGKLGRTLQFPGATPAKLMVCRPISGEPKIIEDPATKAGANVWQCIAEMEVVTVRFLP